MPLPGNIAEQLRRKEEELPLPFETRDHHKRLTRDTPVHLRRFQVELDENRIEYNGIPLGYRLVSYLQSYYLWASLVYEPCVIRPDASPFLLTLGNEPLKFEGEELLANVL